jgi:hypothetical protein
MGPSGLGSACGPVIPSFKFLYFSEPPFLSHKIPQQIHLPTSKLAKLNGFYNKTQEERNDVTRKMTKKKPKGMYKLFVPKCSITRGGTLNYLVRDINHPALKSTYTEVKTRV